MISANILGVIKHVIARFVVLAERAEGFVKDGAEGLGGVAQLTLEVDSTDAFRDEETIVEVGVFPVLGFRRLLPHLLLDLVATEGKFTKKASPTVLMTRP